MSGPASDLEHHALAGVILAGGVGGRLGSVIKASLRIGGIPLLERVANALGGSVSPLIVATGHHPVERFPLLPGLIYVPDAPGPLQGPVGGLMAARAELARQGITTGLLLSVSADTPDLPPGFAATLRDALADGQDGVMAAFDGQLYPTNALWRLESLGRIAAETGGRIKGKGPRHLFPDMGSHDFAGRYDTDPFKNINALSDILYYARRRRAP